VYFPHELKRRVLRGFLERVGKAREETEPETGLFSLMLEVLYILDIFD